MQDAGRSSLRPTHASRAQLAASHARQSTRASRAQLAANHAGRRASAARESPQTTNDAARNSPQPTHASRAQLAAAHAGRRARARVARGAKPSCSLTSVPRRSVALHHRRNARPDSRRFTPLPSHRAFHAPPKEPVSASESTRASPLVPPGPPGRRLGRG